ncbi:NADH-quinone oxidoreductase subunit J, partial [Francisella tularensis subsp. holarctica]|nr:NADH-quinone oxidoreductase subunit J [Francisella tularensis subsp. holarctica]
MVLTDILLYTFASLAINFALVLVL